MLLLVLGLAALLAVSSQSQGRWGSGVRAAVRGVSSKDTRGARDRVSSGVLGFTKAWKDTGPPQRPQGQRTLLQNLTSWGVLGVRSAAARVSGRRPSNPVVRMLLVRPDGSAVEIDHDDNTPYPPLKPGERLHYLDRFGKALGNPWTYEDQQDEAAGPTHKVWLQHRDGALEELAVPDDAPLPVGAYEEAGARVYIEDPTTGGLAELTEPTLVATGHGGTDEGENVTDPSEQGLSYKMPAWTDKSPSYDDMVNARAERGGTEPPEWTARRERQADQDARHPAAATEARADAARQRGGSHLNGSAAAGAIENLPGYGRYMTGLQPQVIGNMEDAQAGAVRLRAQAATMDTGVDTLISLRADAATVAEGRRIAELAHAAADLATQLASREADLNDAITAAIHGLRRHDHVQESHNAGVHLDRPAYDGA